MAAHTLKHLGVIDAVFGMTGRIVGHVIRENDHRRSPYAVRALVGYTLTPWEYSFDLGCLIQTGHDLQAFHRQKPFRRE